MKTLQLTKVAFTVPPLAPTTLTVGYKLIDAAEYTTVTTALPVNVDGTLNAPYNIASVEEGYSYMVMAKAANGQLNYEERVDIPAPAPEVSDLFISIV